MRYRKLGAAMFAIAMLSGVLTGSAFATATTTERNWYTGPVGETKLVGGTHVFAELPKKTMANSSPK